MAFDGLGSGGAYVQDDDEDMTPSNTAGPTQPPHPLQVDTLFEVIAVDGKDAIVKEVTISPTGERLLSDISVIVRVKNMYRSSTVAAAVEAYLATSSDGKSASSSNNADHLD